jgi:hypothetical protein
MSNNQFGRRGAAQNDTAPDSSSGSAPGLTLAELLQSPLTRQLGGILCGVLLVFAAIAIYVGVMKGAGRALDASWAQKTTGPAETIVLEPARDFDQRRPCEVRSLNAKFRELQRELGC